ncbi:TetR/AcrR family transcriptional regulator [Cellulomonas xylanilytica]|uniref:HTH tetR-type domain-containing protein n=1 Tax=Cellulomonas xylanilytica TaxID=233583 RepID=A0A510UZ82_9CELL|nr:TetR/AcrR family transcriptional regulator [Cellulomonas xylanilytica]GEK19889.1 hypothetical protein CXY01_04090 [Cellulomonas xylanilytica]
MPSLWRDSIDAHRHAVHDSVLDAAGEILEQAGPTAVTMSSVAERVGIGRAALYRYFSDSRQILLAWHERQVRAHLDQLREVRARAGSTDIALRDVLETYAVLSSGHALGESATALHAADHMQGAERELHVLLRDLVADGVRDGHVRGDVSVDDLVIYCAQALRAASRMASPEAPRTVSTLVLASLQPGGPAMTSSADVQHVRHRH